MALAKPVSALVEEALSEVDTVSPEEVAGRFDAGEVTILDVREPDEWEQAHTRCGPRATGVARVQGRSRDALLR
jgi:rhodanese-related sulfurtransferase